MNQIYMLGTVIQGGEINMVIKLKGKWAEGYAIDIHIITKLIKGSIIKDKNFKKKVNILLVDDLFDTGATLNEAVDVLKSDINVADVYVLTMTKTGRR